MGLEESPPKEGESNAKEVDKRYYYWCINHQVWCTYNISECKLKSQEDDSKRLT